MFIARMITCTKWEPKQGLPPRKISADAVTGDLRTKNNTLSFWRCQSGTEDDFNDAALAIAAGRNRVDRVEIIWIDDQDLETDEQTLKDTKGRTPVADLVERHVDVCELDYERLGKVAYRIVSALDKNQLLKLPRKRVKRLLVAAVSEGRVDIEALDEKVRTEVEESLAAGQESSG